MIARVHLRDPVTWALHHQNNPARAAAEVFRDCQDEAFKAGVTAGKCELLRIALDTDTRINELLATTTTCKSTT